MLLLLTYSIAHFVYLNGLISVFVYSAMGRRNDTSWWTHSATSHSTTGVTKAVICAILSVGWCL